MSASELTVDRPAARALPGRSIGLAIAFGVVTVVLIPVAYASMFTGFHAYDDEGYFLAVLRAYLAGEPLLNANAPVYGPFFFEVIGGLFKALGVQPTHDAGRTITLVFWLVASLVAGLGAYRLVRSPWLAAGAQLASFSALAALGNEPMQPSVLSSLLLTCLVATAAFRPVKPRLTAGATGAIVAAICLIKLNVGGYAAIAVIFAWSCGLPNKWRRFFLPLTGAVMAGVPVALTFTLLSRDWVLEFAVLVTLSAIAVGISCLLAGRPRGLDGSAMWIVCGGAVLAIVSLGIAVLGGTALRDLWDNLVLFSLRVPRLFVVPLRISPAYDAWAVVGLLLATAAWRWPPRGTAAGLARVAAGFFTWLVLLLPPDAVFLLALPLAWVATRPPAADPGNPTDPYARVLLPSLAVLESLQAFPAAGTELSLAQLALIPVGAVILNDGVRQLRAADPALSVSRRALGAVPRVALSFNVVVFLLFALTAANGFASDTPLGLPGASQIRVPASQAVELRSLVASINGSCSTLITLPGINSLYLWSGQTPPPELRSEVWWLTLDNAHQQAVLEKLQGSPRLCTVRNRSLIDFWALGRPVPDRPLVRFIDSSFTAGGTFGDYELLIRGAPG